MEESLMYPRLPAFRPMFEPPATVAAQQQSSAEVAWLRAMAHGFISEAVQGSSIDEDRAEPIETRNADLTKGLTNTCFQQPIN
jgi:hypothetical protein